MAKKTTIEKELGVAINTNKTVSMALLESYRNALYAVKDFFDQAAKDMKSIEDIELQLKVSLGVCNLGEKLGKNIESLDKLEDKVIREEKAMISRKGSAETSMFES